MYINSSSSVYLLQTVFNLYNSLALKLSIDNIQSVSLTDKREGKKCSLVARAGEGCRGQRSVWGAEWCFTWSLLQGWMTHLCFSLYPFGTQAGPSAWQMLHVCTVSRQPSAMRMKVSLLPPMVMGMASPCASDRCESGRCWEWWLPHIHIPEMCVGSVAVFGRVDDGAVWLLEGAR